jgi:hypothetical protein
VCQPPKGEASQKADPGGDSEQLDRVLSNQLPGPGKGMFAVMIFDVGSGSINFVCRAFREVFDPLRALVAALANRGGGGVKVVGSVLCELVDLLCRAGSFLNQS